MIRAFTRFLAKLVRRPRILRKIVPGLGQAGVQELSLLRHLRKRSRPVIEIARHLKIPSDAALTALLEIESRGLVRLSPDQGSHTTRIAALTALGREALKKR